EGAEYSIIAQCARELQRFGHLAIETHFGYRESDLLDLIKGAGFDVTYFRSNVGNVYGNGFIKASQIR
ncbi:MAG TPA: hypothetical protein VM260_13905, partial [Pirellula sp.]|nr:hypothetical protein [Pirellula sp.]